MSFSVCAKDTGYTIKTVKGSLAIDMTDKQDINNDMDIGTEQPVMLEEAVSILLSRAEKISDTEEVALRYATGRVLAEDVCATRDQPPFDRSPLDGYAVRAEDTKGASQESPVALKVITEVDAGVYYSGMVNAGEAVRIMTGAPIPAGTDTVIGQEDTDYGEETVMIYEEMKPHQNYCYRGEDYKKGDVLLASGDHIGPAEAGIIASTGKQTVKVYRRPRVLLVSTGDEVVMPGEELAEGKIYDSNLFTIDSQLRAWGIDVVDMFHSADDAGHLAAAIEEKLDGVDLVVTTGGVSVGKKDIMHDVFRLLGAERLFWRVRIKPGMAMLAGNCNGKYILALSGNPYAAFANLHMVVRPVLDALNGNDHLSMHRFKAVLMNDYGKDSPTRRFIRAYVNDGKAYIEGHTGGNGDIYSGHKANAMVDIPAGSGRLDAGDKVDVILL